MNKCKIQYQVERYDTGNKLNYLFAAHLLIKERNNVVFKGRVSKLLFEYSVLPKYALLDGIEEYIGQEFKLLLKEIKL